MPGRKYNAGSYRFSFNGKETDNEWGNTGIQDYGFRLYNPAIAKFLSVDPLAPEYPWYTPYQFAGNMPIRFIDRDGLEQGNPAIFDSKGLLISPALDMGYATMYMPQQMLDEQANMYNQAYIANNPIEFTVVADRENGEMLGGYATMGAEIAVGFTPAGILIDGKDIVQAGMDGDVVGVIVATVAIIPVLEWAKQAYKARKLQKKLDKAGFPKIKSGQKGDLDSDKVDRLKKDMADGNYKYDEPRGQIGGYKDKKGNVKIDEGNNRTRAAVDHFDETGDTKPLKKLLDKGHYTPTDNLKNTGPVNKLPKKGKKKK